MARLKSTKTPILLGTVGNIKDPSGALRRIAGVDFGGLDFGGAEWGKNWTRSGELDSSDYRNGIFRAWGGASVNIYWENVKMRKCTTILASMSSGQHTASLFGVSISIF